ncbi:MAG: DUF4433 domain-containing protein [Gammaproteobacteria bacterium]|jgi:hypothetical protein|nr:DUF4433 domain-containing protein [Gammaproteobacteria bacterium]
MIDTYFEKIIHPDDPYLFHITHVTNLEKIIKSNALICRNEAPNFTDSSHLDVQKKRMEIDKIPSGFSKSLHDYVPFYFAPLSPMLCAIHNGRVPNKIQEDMIYFVSRVSRVVQNRIPYIFSDGHPITIGLSDFYQDLKDLSELDWELMKAKYWADTEEDGDRKRRRQAEFLLVNSCPLSIISSICVKDQTKLEYVKEAFMNSTNSHTPQFRITEGWYY